MQNQNRLTCEEEFARLLAATFERERQRLSQQQSTSGSQENENFRQNTATQQEEGD
jgi:hypothetical protein